MTTRIWVRKNNKEIPVIKVQDQQSSDQIIISFNFSTSHITIHKLKDGILLRTHHDKNKSSGEWDEAKKAIAKDCGYKNWEKHGQYYIHTPLLYAEDMEGKLLQKLNYEVL